MATTATTAADSRDGLVRRVTAFESWAEMEAAMADGYVPTVHVTDYDPVSTRLLRDAIKGAGYSVFPEAG